MTKIAPTLEPIDRPWSPHVDQVRRAGEWLDFVLDPPHRRKHVYNAYALKHVAEIRGRPNGESHYVSRRALVEAVEARGYDAFLDGPTVFVRLPISKHAMRRRAAQFADQVRSRA